MPFLVKPASVSEGYMADKEGIFIILLKESLAKFLVWVKIKQISSFY
jgi:hypothetical protein